MFLAAQAAPEVMISATYWDFTDVTLASKIQTDLTDSPVSSISPDSLIHLIHLILSSGSRTKLKEAKRSHNVWRFARDYVEHNHILNVDSNRNLFLRQSFFRDPLAGFPHVTDPLSWCYQLPQPRRSQVYKVHLGFPTSATISLDNHIRRMCKYSLLRSEA